MTLPVWDKLVARYEKHHTCATPTPGSTCDNRPRCNVRSRKPARLWHGSERALYRAAKRASR